MAFLETDMREKIRERLLALPGPAKLLFFTQDPANDACERAEGLVREVVALSDKLTLEVFDKAGDKKKAEEYGVTRVPALVLEGPAGARVKLFGKLAGYEFAVFLAALKDTAAGKAAVGDAAAEKLDWVAQPATIKVFVTPTCVHCPKVARTAQRFAIAYGLVTAEVIDITEFPDVAEYYEVDQVPKVIINERVMMVGSPPEHIFAQAVSLSVQGESCVKPQDIIGGRI